MLRINRFVLSLSTLHLFSIFNQSCLRNDTTRQKHYRMTIPSRPEQPRDLLHKPTSLFTDSSYTASLLRTPTNSPPGNTTAYQCLYRLYCIGACKYCTWTAPALRPVRLTRRAQGAPRDGAAGFPGDPARADRPF